MKISIASGLLILVLVAVSTGWLVDRTYHHLSDSEKTKQLSDSIQLGITVGCVIDSNRIYGTFESDNRDELLKHQLKDLAENVLDMALCDAEIKNSSATWAKFSDEVDIPDSDTFISLASHSLQILEVSSVPEFEQLLIECKVSTNYGGEQVIADKKVTGQISQFVTVALRSKNSAE